MVPFLKLLADRLLDRHGTELRDVAVVLPSRRAATWLRRRLAEAAKAPLWSPDIHTFPTLTQRLSGLAPADPLTGAFILHQVQCELFPDDHWSIEDTLNIAPTLLSDMSEVDAQLIDLKQLYRDLAAFSEIEDWSYRLGGELSLGQERHRQFWKRQGLIHEHFNRMLAARGMGTQGAMERDAAQRTRSAGILPWKEVWVAGVNALTVAQKQLLDHFRARGALRVAWDGDVNYVGHSEHEAGEALRELITRYGPGEIPLCNGLLDMERTVEEVHVPNATSQVHAVVEQLLRLPAEERERTAVVLPEEHLLVPLLAAMPDELRPFNVTMGIRLQGLPIGALASALFNALLNHEEGRGYRVQDLQELVAHPFVRTSAISTSLQSLLHDLRSPRVRMRELCDALGQDDAMTLERTLATLVTPGTDLPQRALALIHWALTTPDLSDLGREQLHAWSIMLQLLERHLREIPDALDGRTWIALHDRLLRQERLDLEGEPLRGLQIMGFLETRALDHDRLFMLSCNEGSLPPARADRSFIPFDIRRVMGLPLPVHSDKVNAYHFHRAMQRTRHVALLHHDGSGDDTAEPSRYLAQWQLELGTTRSTQWRKSTCLPQDMARAFPMLAVQKTPSVLRLLEDRLDKGLSASTINSYLACPLEFFHTQLWARTPKDPIDTRIPQDALGSAVHAVYEVVYRPYKGMSVPPQALLMDRQEIQSMLVDKLLADGIGLELDRGEPLLQVEMATAAILRNLKHEGKALEHHVGDVLIDVEMSLQGGIDVDGRHIPLIGTADRVIARQGRIHIYDLKTGSVDPKKLDLFGTDGSLNRDHPMAIQLAFYAYLMLQHMSSIEEVRAVVVPLRKPSVALQSFLRVYGSDVFTREHTVLFADELRNVIREILSHDRPFTHNADALYCRTCIA
ncbi:MAG: PD-(D/E)XK nuclease family protein [Flavobacteriales bacterium]|nr:PD-(D/E)XK nuclease family protein [Flavobacteriales bacterium]